MTVLSVKDVTVRFGGLVANDAISFDVAQGMLAAVIGPNGAGKTTLFNVISGAMAPTSGTVHFNGELITGLPQYEVSQKGLVRTYLWRIWRPTNSLMASNACWKSPVLWRQNQACCCSMNRQPV